MLSIYIYIYLYILEYIFLYIYYMKETYVDGKRDLLLYKRDLLLHLSGVLQSWAARRRFSGALAVWSSLLLSD